MKFVSLPHNWQILALLLFITGGCKTTGLSGVQQQKQFKKMEWLTGRWQNISPEMNMTEKWEKISDTLFRATSTMILARDTIYSEDIKLAPAGRNIYYSIVSHNPEKQNTSSYVLTKNSGTTIIFEDPKNTEQNKITYIHKSDDILILKIEGIDEGRSTEETYHLKRTSR